MDGGGTVLLSGVEYIYTLGIVVTLELLTWTAPSCYVKYMLYLAGNRVRHLQDIWLPTRKCICGFPGHLLYLSDVVGHYPTGIKITAIYIQPKSQNAVDSLAEVGR